MAQATQKNTALPSAEQIECRGYIITEDADLALKDVSVALDTLALVFDEQGDSSLDVSGGGFAAVLRVFSRQTRQIYDDAAFANRALARPRNVH